METLSAIFATETATTTAAIAAATATEASIVAGADAMLLNAGLPLTMPASAVPTATSPGFFSGLSAFTRAHSGTIALAGTGISAGSSIMGGLQQSRALAFERAQMEAQAEQTRLSAAIDENNRMARLNSMLEAQRAMAIGKGYSLDSPDLEAIAEDTEENALADIGVARLNIEQRGRSSRLGAAQSDYLSRAAISRGFIGAGSSLFNYGSRP